jgi:ABC-type uncharacterized transport system substrate-binding protein
MSIAFIISLILSNSASAAGKPLRIALLLWRGETAAERGFKDGLKDLGYTVEYNIMSAGQDREGLRRTLNNEIAPKLNDLDYIYTFGTTVSKMTKIFIHNRVPQLFNIVFAPVEADIVRSMEKTGGNISGATNVVPVSVRIAAALKIMQFKRLGLLFNPREKNTMIQRQEVYDVSKKFHFEVVDLRSPPALDMLQQNLKKLIDKTVVVDAVYLPNDSFLISKAKLIGAQLRVARVKGIGSIRDFIDNGVLMGHVVDYYKLGRAVATIVDRHQKGENLAEIPVYKVLEPTLMINKTTSEILNFRIPEALKKKAIIVD